MQKAEIDLDRLREAYLATGSQAKAAAVLGISDRTLNRRRKDDPALAAVLDETHAEVQARRPRPAHGTRSRYATCTDGENGGRCEDCKRANRDAAAAGRLARRNRRKYPKAKIPHGLGGYRNYGCRCDICSEAASKAMADYREALAAREAEQRRRNGLVA